MLGDFHTTLKNKYYFDELYGRIFVAPSQWFAKSVAYEFIDLGIIDGTLHLTGRIFTWIGDLLKNLNLWLIDGVGDGIPELIGKFGGWIRWLQSGSVQQYMLFAAIAVLILSIIFALSTGVLQAAP
jgi:NADH:ubiquinone oxidoreductase subunit 5 (subunit L)/multisubunit Na+/H+ antiporter MnhA subunit